MNRQAIYLFKASLIALAMFSMVSLPANAEKRTKARDNTVESLERDCRDEGATSTLADYTTGKVTCGWSNGNTRECDASSNGESICEDTIQRATIIEQRPVLNVPAKVFYDF